MAEEDKKELFDELLTHHMNVIYRVCWGFTSNKHDVEDLYQEILLNVWKGLDGFRRESKTTTWLHKIAINTCLMWKKKENRMPKFDEQGFTHLSTEQREWEQDVDPKLENLRKTIQKLKPTDRSIIILLMEGHSYQEIAEITGMSPNNVGVKINRVKTRIKKLLNQTKS